MAEMLGANLDELQRLSANFAAAARTIVSLRGQVERLMSAPWAGRTGDQFRHAWAADHRAKLQAVVDGLNDASHQIDRQRNDQAEASSVAGSSAASAANGSSGVPHIADPLRRFSDGLVTPIGDLGTAIGLL